MTDYEKAIQYVREHKTWSEAREIVAEENIELFRCPLYMADRVIYDDIHDLMEEYGAENDLPEGWWLEEGDEEDVYSKL